MFRIEYASSKSDKFPRLRQWSVKVPTGLYETLFTNNEGRGLYKHKTNGISVESLFELTQLLAEDELFIPEDATKDQSIVLLEEGLKKLGWDQDFFVRIKYVYD